MFALKFPADEFKKKEGIDLRKDAKALQRLTEAAEKAWENQGCKNNCNSAGLWLGESCGRGAENSPASFF